MGTVTRWFCRTPAVTVSIGPAVTVSIGAKEQKDRLGSPHERSLSR
jgi:hypothetical protein